jgi:hypothetical protein
VCNLNTCNTKFSLRITYLSSEANTLVVDEANLERMLVHDPKEGSLLHAPIRFNSWSRHHVRIMPTYVLPEGLAARLQFLSGVVAVADVSMPSIKRGGIATRDDICRFRVMPNP